MMFSIVKKSKGWNFRQLFTKLNQGVYETLFEGVDALHRCHNPIIWQGMKWGIEQQTTSIVSRKTLVHT